MDGTQETVVSIKMENIMEAQQKRNCQRARVFYAFGGVVLEVIVKTKQS